MNPLAFLRRMVAARRDKAALIRNHSLLVDEALAAQRAGASIATVATIVTGAHRTQLATEPYRERLTAVRLDRRELPR
jgi:hypothetical protein